MLTNCLKFNSQYKKLSKHEFIYLYSYENITSIINNTSNLKYQVSTSVCNKIFSHNSYALPSVKLNVAMFIVALNVIGVGFRVMFRVSSDDDVAIDTSLVFYTMGFAFAVCGQVMVHWTIFIVGGSSIVCGCKVI